MVALVVYHEGMSLNIKNEETHALVRELSDLTGENLTTAITVAVRERLERLRLHEGATAARAEALLAIGCDAAGRLDEAARTVDHGELLYDDRGLPR